MNVNARMIERVTTSCMHIHIERNEGIDDGTQTLGGLLAYIRETHTIVNP